MLTAARGGELRGAAWKEIDLDPGVDHSGSAHEDETRAPGRFLRLEEGCFPRPVSVGGRAVGWIETEVDQWMRERIAAR